MKKIQFKLLFVMIISSVIVKAQQHKIYSNSFETNQFSTAILNFENVEVHFESSNDGKFHINYSLIFENYSKKEIKEFLAGIKNEINFNNNHLSITTSSIKEIRKLKKHYYFSEGISVNSDYFLNSKDTMNDGSRKTTTSISNEINKESTNSSIDMYKTLDGKPISEILEKNKSKIFKSKFIISIPKIIKTTINAKDSRLIFNDKIINELAITLKRGSLKAKHFENHYNKFKIEDADFKVEYLNGGSYTLTNISNGLFGIITDIDISSEFSKIEIGEIQEKVRITDFNSKYWFYNFSEKFKRFDLQSEYTEIHFFNPKSDYSYKVIGNNTVHYIDKMKITMQPTKNGEKFNMMEKKPKGIGHYSGHMNFDIIHGIIYNETSSNILLSEPIRIEKIK